MKTHAMRPTEELQLVYDQLDKAYRERNNFIKLITHMYPSFLIRPNMNDDTTDTHWTWVVVVNLPTGQVAWKIQDSELSKFQHLQEHHEIEHELDPLAEQMKYVRLELLAKRMEIR